MKNFIHIIEVIVWIVVVFIVVSLCINSYKMINNEKGSYSLEFSDIDGIDIGAPVNFMGVDVGSVSGIKQKGNNVVIDFTTDNPNLKFPKGSTVSIQFTGLVGSKTLEIEPPKEPSHSNETLIAITPIRITNFVEISAKTSESLASGSQNILKTFGKGTIEFIKYKINDVKNFSYTALDATDFSYHALKDSKTSIENAIDDLNSYFSNLIVLTNNFNDIMTKNDYKNNSKSFVRLLKFSFAFVYETFKSPKYKELLGDANRAFLFFNRLMNYNKLATIKKVNSQLLIDYMDNLNNRLFKTSGIFSKIYNKIKNIDPNKFFENLLNKSDKVEKTTNKLQEAI